jgi:endonuclease-8
VGDVPEGDTIWLVAARLRPALAGHVLERFEAPTLVGDRPRPGTRIESVEAVGKHLLIHFDGGLSLQTHLRMTGSWHLYAPGETWPEPAHPARVIIATSQGTAVCFAAPVIRTFRRDVDHPLSHLGPDLTSPDPDIDAAARRLAVLPAGTAVKVALLDQRVAAGIGNVYASEVCHACGVDPFRRLADLDDATRRQLFEVAHRLLRANLASPVRTTTGLAAAPVRLAVYGRARRPCLRCRTPIQSARQGDLPRVTYWCPQCQT